MEGLRRCTKCGIRKTVAEFGKDKQKSDGLLSACKACKKIYDEHYREKLRQLKRTASKLKCARCKKVKPVIEFTRATTLSGYHGYCTPCRRIYSREERRKKPAKTLLMSAKRRARERGIKFNLKESDISVPTHCPVLGIKLSYSDTGFSDFSPTLDRIIPSKGYVPENVVVVSYRANRFKSDASLAEMKAGVRFYSKLFAKLKQVSK